ncbi:thiamine diphosphokinase [Sphingobacterium endophyticum]|uniref:thiamine diphosphokinase n=1 Tax=Sphingobacterium endophyticum TaxID=2546448 RepID=UPI0012E152EB|nr:thiamine diphosphokinase [Sphingobacterium endophyticum]
MSSHHIVRENQEPALFIFDSTALSTKYLNQLLEWSPTLISTSSQYDILRSREIKVDVILDNQQFPADLLEENITVIPYTTSFLNSLFTYLREKKNFAVNIVTDEPDGEKYLSYLSEFVVILLNGSRKTLMVKKYEKWLPKGFSLIIERFKGDYSKLINLVHTGGNEFHVKEDGFISIPAQEDYIFISEEI